MEQVRSSIEEAFKWDLSKIYGSISEYKNDILLVKNDILKISKYQDVKVDETSLYNLLNLSMRINRIIEKLEAYTSLLCDEDTSLNKNLELKEEIINIAAKYISATHFIETNILKLDYVEIEKFYLKNEKLKEYEIMLLEMFRFKDHVLSDKEEKILADMSKALGNNYSTYELFKDSDLTFPSFIVNDKEYSLTNNTYSLYIENDNREIREKAFNNLYDVYKQYKNTFANLIISNIKEETVISKIRKYKTPIEKFLYKDELDDSIYDNLVTAVNSNLDVIYKYYDLKKRILGYDELHLYDVYANLIKNDKFTYPFEVGKKTVIEALSVFGKDYISILTEGLNNRWIDVYPNKGKRTGGYSSGSYDTYPYILLNYQDKYDDMSTLSHELGHSMHSYYARHNNPYQYGYYSIFVAEVASTVNELMLAKYVIKNSKNKDEKLFVLNRLMELFRTTIFRQTMFSEFEKYMYDSITEDIPLTADKLSDKYYSLNLKYFGKKVFIDDSIKYEWERIPHFYYNFYVYKYATGLSAACYIVNGILDGNISTDDYISFLKCGKTKNPIDSLKVASCDLTDKKVILSAIDMFNDVISQFENIYFD